MLETIILEVKKDEKDPSKSKKNAKKYEKVEVVNKSIILFRERSFFAEILITMQFLLMSQNFKAI